MSLSANPRLRKLRLTEDEDLVNGTEYTQRLRQQFERLYPLPEWASVPYRKRRRLSNSPWGSGDESTSIGNMSINSEELFTQPLAKLLQNTSSLTRPKSHVAKSRRKFRPEVLDIQRTKDVGAAQPVSISVFNVVVKGF